MKRGNCLLWSFLQQYKYGGYIRFGWLPNYYAVPRCSWSLDGKEWWRYTPISPVLRPNKIQKLFPIHVLYFKGKVIKDAANQGSNLGIR